MSDISASRRRLSAVLLAGGYTAATAAGARIVPAIRDRNVGQFVAFEAGTAAVVLGLLLRRRRISAALNAATLVGTAMAWSRYGRKPSSGPSASSGSPGPSASSGAPTG